MTISERARAGMMPPSERPISEEYRLAAKDWVEAQKAARLYEEMKTATLAQMKTNLMKEMGDMADAKADRLARSSKDWSDYIHAMVEAEAAANFAKVKMKWVELRYGEWQSSDANARRERQMGRQTP